MHTESLITVIVIGQVLVQTYQAFEGSDYGIYLQKLLLQQAILGCDVLLEAINTSWVGGSLYQKEVFLFVSGSLLPIHHILGTSQKSLLQFTELNNQTTDLLATSSLPNNHDNSVSDKNERLLDTRNHILTQTLATRLKEIKDKESGLIHPWISQLLTQFYQ